MAFPRERLRRPNTFRYGARRSSPICKLGKTRQDPSLRPRLASRFTPGPATNVAPLAPPYGATARDGGRGPRDTKRAATERKEETKKEAQDAKDAKHKMPAREPIRMRRAKTWDVEVENAYRFQCAGWRSAEEYAQGEYGDEISWFSDSGLVEKVQNRQGLFMYFKRRCGGVRTSSSMASPRRRGAWLGLAVAVREKRVRHAGTASASTSTCRASRSSSTRTTAATSR